MLGTKKQVLCSNLSVLISKLLELVYGLIIQEYIFPEDSL